MTDLAQAVRNRYPGNTYLDIARADGDTLPPQLALQSNPPQSTADIGFSRYTSRSFFDREMQLMWHSAVFRARAMAGTSTIRSI